MSVREVLFSTTSSKIYENTVKRPEFMSSLHFLTSSGGPCWDNSGLMFDSPALDHVFQAKRHKSVPLECTQHKLKFKMHVKTSIQCQTAHTKFCTLELKHSRN